MLPSINHVGLYSRLNLLHHGGLETYARSLTDFLTEQNVLVSWNGTPPSEFRDINPKWQAWGIRMLPLMTRAPLRFAARMAAEHRGAAWCRQSIGTQRIIHFIGTGWDLVGFPLQRAAHRRSAIMTCWPAVHPGSWGDAPLDIDLYRRVDAVFAQSDYEVNYLAERGVPREKLVRTACASSVSSAGNGARFRRQHDLAGKHLVLFVGRKSREKGYHALRQAIGQLAECGQSVTLVSIGRDVDPPYPPLDARFDIDLGAATDETKQDALAACDVFALPSEAESFGIVYLEAWAYGKPVICGTAPASRELVIGNDGGLATDGSARDIARQLVELFSDREHRQCLGQNGQRALAAHYTPEATTQTHLDTWARLSNQQALSECRNAGSKGIQQTAR
jgi:glycosyltransferase involved in cell wall biosynthesis